MTAGVRVGWWASGRVEQLGQGGREIPVTRFKDMEEGGRLSYGQRGQREAVIKGGVGPQGHRAERVRAKSHQS